MGIAPISLGFQASANLFQLTPDKYVPNRRHVQLLVGAFSALHILKLAPSHGSAPRFSGSKPAVLLLDDEGIHYIPKFFLTSFNLSGGIF